MKSQRDLLIILSPEIINGNIKSPYFNIKSYEGLFLRPIDIPYLFSITGFIISSAIFSLNLFKSASQKKIRSYFAFLTPISIEYPYPLFFLFLKYLIFLNFLICSIVSSVDPSSITKISEIYFDFFNEHSTLDILGPSLYAQTIALTFLLPFFLFIFI